MITSTSNSKVKELIRLRTKSRAREEEGLFLVEGPRMAEEIPSEQIDCLYVSQSYGQKNKERLNLLQAEGIRMEVLSDEVFARVSDTQTPQGVLASVHMLKYEFCDIVGGRKGIHADGREVKNTLHGRANLPLVLVLDNLQDPGNVGTILRTAEAAGATGILMSRDCVDVYNPKVIRSTMGAVFRLPFFCSDDLVKDIEELKLRGLKVYAAHLEGRRDYDREDYRCGCAFLIGNEGNGLRPDVAACADFRIRIPMEGQVESLNAAVAASILMFEAARQRRGK